MDDEMQALRDRFKKEVAAEEALERKRIPVPGKSYLDIKGWEILFGQKWEGETVEHEGRTLPYTPWDTGEGGV